jgi:dipeptidyl aminopeptidase/acylaminoacyl peptidase
MVQSGYALLTVNHRGSNGYGTEFRDLPRGDYGFGHVKDLASGADFLRSLPEVDPARVGILGYSMGGYLALFAVTTRPDSFKVGISVFGLGEITNSPGKHFTWHLGGTEAEIPEAYRNASPVTHVSKINAPVLIIHGEEDRIEPITKVRNFVYEMDKYDKSYELWIYQNETHGLKRLNNQLDSYQRIMNFLQMNLRSN